ncbi:DUF2634 domain-containing protein [Clostridium tyrobutyricum]|uniref:DUF2634 domain-containing protein n=1 Tax=Clostridium tyrobutyricum TaxID=1519 RepID=UPI001C390C83|nr:DUF2634 domain-containing protein [Clostridium tyrobutyricum]MBV4423249.1 DUF2634 domain-containing protein [Clostridium tyrobutyricum]
MSIMPEVYDVDIPDPQVEVQYEEDDIQEVPREYAWDFEKNDFLLKDGKFIIVEGIEAIKIWIWKALHTPKLIYSIYSDTYGHDIESLVGKGFSYDLMETEIKRFVTESLTQIKYVNGISDFYISEDGSLYNVGFMVNTDLGDIEIEDAELDIPSA